MEFKWAKKCPEIGNNTDIVPIRIQTTWTKTMSLIYVTLANTTKITGSYRVKQRLLNNIAQNWSKNGYKESNILVFHY